MGVEKDQFELTRLAAACNCKPFLLSTSPHFIAPNVYDNKQAESVTPSAIIKAKKYQEIHGTRYVIIVSSMLPKRDVKSGLLGDRDSIYLVHPLIVVPFAKYLEMQL